MTEVQLRSLLSLLDRIATALESIAPTALEKKAREQSLYKKFSMELVNVWKRELGLNLNDPPNNDQYLEG